MMAGKLPTCQSATMSLICIRVVVLALAMTAVLVSADTEFYAINGLLCLKSQFIVTHGPISIINCATLCNQLQDCQGFTVAKGSCQMFVFNKCSRNFRNCSCTDRGQVFVKRLPGLPPRGSLCPSGFANGVCGTKYKLFTGYTEWATAKAAIDAEAGLVTMADVIDSTEFKYTFNLLVAKYNHLNSLMLGGRQYPGTVASNKNSWYWVSCNTKINISVWNSGEPNNDGDQNGAFTADWQSNGMIDILITSPIAALAECVSPFDD